MKTHANLRLGGALALGGLLAGISCQAVAAAGTQSCMEVEVNGERAPSYTCLTEKLQPAASSGNPATLAGPRSEAIARQPSNQLGLFNRAATSHRMGNQFGVSVHPQRPPETPRGPIIPRP
jgi:hypothetical protein